MTQVLRIMAAVGAAALVVAAFCLGRATAPCGDVERDTVVVREVVRDLFPQPTRTTIARRESAMLPMLGLRPIGLALTRTDTVKIADTVLVEVPITQTEYRTDDYYAVVEGYRARLLQVDVFPELRTVTERVTTQRRWGLTLGAQVGYGITPVGAQPYAGVGITFGYRF